ncbi:MAG TPA: M28 family peptidase [Burkholderiales bacterium]|nr:M28 family peptidase [Burkholderiales bacterium]
MTLPRGYGRLVLIAAVLLAIAAVVFASWFMTATPGASHRGPLPPLDPEGRRLAENLRKHVVGVASEEHNVAHPAALERSARYIEATLKGLGYAVSRQEFETKGVKVRNLEVRKGAGEKVVVIGAHYDSAQDAVGADDNGSGVAALIELARFLKTVQPAEGLEVRLVFYVNEELPWFGTDNMGSFVHSMSLVREGREVVAMLSLETIGWYSENFDSQRYPFPFSLFYPSKGNFVGFVANLSSRSLMRRVVGAFRRAVEFPSEGVAAPESIPGIGWSDQWAYWKFGWPAVMVTDTAVFRYPHYHTLRDTPDKVSYERLARVVKGLESVLRDLAGPG